MKSKMGIAAGILCGVALATTTVHADLDAAQIKLLAEAKKHLDQGEANLQVALDGLGAGAVSPAKTKLALTRMGAVKAAVANANVRLEKLPSGEADVQAQQKRSGALSEAVKKVEDQLTQPKTPSAPETPSAPAAPGAPAKPAEGAAAAGAKLDYRQQESLKNARFHTREVAGAAAALAELSAKVSKAEDANQVDYRELSRGINTIEAAKRKIKNAQDQLAAVPADGAGVAEASTELKTAADGVEASEKVIAPAHQKLMAAIDPKNHPAISEDIKRMRELASMYDTQLFESRRDRAVVVVTETPAAVRENERIAKQYALLIRQQTDEGKNVEGVSKYFQTKLAEFNVAAKQQKESLPAQIEADLTQASKLADEAVANKKPAFFTGGIVQQMDAAAEKIAVLAVLDADAGKTKLASLERAKVTMKERQAALKEGIIQTNSLPNNAFAQSDRKAVEQAAIDAWKALQPDAQVLMVRVPSQNWERESMWRYQNSWYYIDRSRLQAQVIVKHDDKLAVIRPINLWIDHVSNDKRTAFPLDEMKDELPPQRFMLLEKVK